MESALFPALECIPMNVDLAGSRETYPIDDDFPPLDDLHDEDDDYLPNLEEVD